MRRKGVLEHRHICRPVVGDVGNQIARYAIIALCNLDLIVNLE